jgi:AraC-like DNA-binding protein
MDPFSDIIALLRPSAAMSKPITARGPWGVSYEAHHGPGFTIILKGECWFSFDGHEPIRAQRGDFLLLPSTPAFSMGSDRNVKAIPGHPARLPVRHGQQDGEPDFVSLGGTFHIEPVNAPLLLALLPSLIYIPAASGRSERLGRVIDLVMDECAHEEPGKEMVLERLLEVLLIEALRWQGMGSGDVRAGLLSGMRDPALARVLRAMHEDVRTNWTVVDLARIAGMSRSAFAARFGQVLGCGPFEYLVRWRMALAKDALMRGTKTLENIAEEIGYESASAFSTAFRKRLGVPPGRFAREAVGVMTH